ncbi:MAG: dockerin type I repeat-containing protein [candidate division Zixibacteria bacterium]|nr:dockerin type I repeat-containing protein [candidate division Zixibacteria bacterium]
MRTKWKRLGMVYMVLMLVLASSPDLSAQNPASPVPNGDVTIHLNGGADVAYIGDTNTIEFWIRNDAKIMAMSIAFEFTIGRSYYFDPTHGPKGYVRPVGDAVDAFDMGGHQENKRIDNVTPDSVLFGGVAQFNGLPVHMTLALCYTMKLFIPPGQNPLPDGLCIDNIFSPPAGQWTFVEEDQSTYPPTYQGNPNASSSNPDAPPVCFDIVNLPSVSFCQIDFVLDGSTYANSDWGKAILTHDGFDDVRYFNLNVDGIWSLQNIPIVSVEQDVVQSIAFVFDLGVPAGTDITSIQYGYSLTATALSTKPPISGTAAVTDCPEICYSGISGVPVPLPGPAGPIILGPIFLPPVVNPVHPNFPNQEAGLMECVPTAVSNSLKFLKEKYNLDIKDDDISIDSLKRGCGFIPGWGCDADEWWKDKKAYLEEKKIPITTRKETDISKLKEELEKGQDVELEGEWHCAAIVGIIRLADGRYVILVAHDKQQGHGGGMVVEPVVYDPTTGKLSGSPGFFDGSSLLYGVVECPKTEETPGTNRDNTNKYNGGNPEGSPWHELYPAYCRNWTLDKWHDNGDSTLSYCDTVEFTDDQTHARSIEHIEEVTTTITVTQYNPPTSDTIYADFWYGNPDMGPIIPEPGDLWHEVYPVYSRLYRLEWWDDNGSGKLDSCDYLTFKRINPLDSTTLYCWHVEKVEVDIISTPLSCCDMPGDANNDGLINIRDITYLINYLYRSGPLPPCAAEGDANGDGVVNIRDITYLINYLYRQGPAPVCP